MLCGGFYLILGFPFTSEMRMFLYHFFLAPEGHLLAFVLNPVLMRRASPCVALISSGQQQQFYRTTSNLYPTIPHSTLKVLCGKIPPPKKLTTSPSSPAPTLAAKFSTSTHPPFPSAVKGASSRQTGTWRTRCEIHTEQNLRDSLAPLILGSAQYD